MLSVGSSHIIYKIVPHSRFSYILYITIYQRNLYLVILILNQYDIGFIEAVSE